MGDKIILMWPIILTHRITADSPLYDMRPADLSAEKMEIILFLTGTVEATGEVSRVVGRGEGEEEGRGGWAGGRGGGGGRNQW